MRRPQLKRWVNATRDEGLLFFAQRLEECLFDYTLDSYKARALNTRTRLREMQVALVQIRRRRLHSDAIQPMCLELAESVARDAAAQQLLGAYAVIYRDKRTWEKLEWRIAQAHIDQALTLIDQRYEQTIVSFLRKHLPGLERKEDLHNLISDLVVEWIEKGFAPSYIFFRTRRFFFRLEGPPVDGMISFDRFIEYFNVDKSAWRVLLTASPAFKRLNEVVDDEFFEVFNDPRDFEPHSKEEEEYLSDGQGQDGAVILFPTVRARDARAAMEDAFDALHLVSSISQLHIHRYPFDWRKEAVVTGEAGFPPLRLGEPKRPIEKHPEGSLWQLPDRFRNTFGAFTPTDLEPAAIDRVYTALRHHSFAVQAQTREGQLINLWTAFECLLPLSLDDTRIAKAVAIGAPLLSKDYPLKLIEDIHLSFRRCLRREYQEILDAIPHEGPARERCALLLATQEHEAGYDELRRLCEFHPLLRARAAWLHFRLQRADRVSALIDAHERRVAWHLHRIYRSRNLLVHAGQTVPYLSTLVENIHAYVDRILLLLQEVYSRSPRPQSFEAALRSLQFDHEVHRRSLREHGAQRATEENWKQILLSPNPVAREAY